jgi:hypothetical protein
MFLLKVNAGTTTPFYKLVSKPQENFKLASEICERMNGFLAELLTRQHYDIIWRLYREEIRNKGTLVVLVI